LSADPKYKTLKSPPRGGFFLSAEAWLLWVKLLFFWLLVSWLSRLVFMARCWALFEEFSSGALFQTFIAGWPLDLSTACYLTLFQCLLSLPFMFHRRSLGFLNTWMFIQTALLATGYWILTLTDTELLPKWGNRINDQVFIYLEHPKEVMAFSSGAPWLSIVLWFAAGMMLSLFSYHRLLQLRIPSVRPALWHNPYLRHAALFILLPLGMRGGLGTVPLNQSAAAHANETRLNILAVNSFWNFGYYLTNGTRNIPFEQYYCCPDDEMNAAADFFYSKDSIHTRITETSKPNVLLIILEGFTAKGSKRLHGLLDCMPQLDRIAAEGVSFQNAIAAGDRTDKGLASILSGWMPQPWHSVLHEPEKAARLPSLTANLAAAGYQTLFTYGGDLRFADMKAYLMATGFKECYDQADYPAAQQNSKWGAHDEFVYLKLLEQLKHRASPWFGTLLSLSSHEPFEVPGGSLEGTETDKFRASLQYADRCLGNFMQEARNTTWYANTLVIITADHGHDIGLKPEHSFHPDLFRIPLIVTGGALKKSLKGTVIHETVSQAHLSANLLLQLGHKPTTLPYSTWFDGRSDYAYYAFNSGFGLVRDSLCIIGENQPLRRTLFTGSEGHKHDGLFEKAAALQQFWIKKYQGL
jgi:hypothetical protein